MDNPETVATADINNSGRTQAKQKTETMSKTDPPKIRGWSHLLFSI
jgi:hypothetical protein